MWLDAKLIIHKLVPGSRKHILQLACKEPKNVGKTPKDNALCRETSTLFVFSRTSILGQGSNRFSSTWLMFFAIRISDKFSTIKRNLV